MLILYFHIFQGGFEVLNAIFQASVYLKIVKAIVFYKMCHSVREFLNISLVVELLIYSKNISLFSRIKTIHLFKNP